MLRDVVFLGTEDFLVFGDTEILFGTGGVCIRQWSMRVSWPKVIFRLQLLKVVDVGRNFRL